MEVKIKNRPKGGIEPLCRQTATGLKPAPQTTEAHPGDSYGSLKKYILNSDKCIFCYAATN